MDDSINLPPGFRFHPTDEEIITHYLYPKMVDTDFSPIAIGEVDFNKVEPWDLPSKANMGEKEWFFFFQKDRKYPTGTRTNRATKSGYWKATGKDKEIYNGKGCLVGMKKTLVFYKGRAPKGERTNWVMHEFRVEGMSSLRSSAPKASKDEWVVSKVFHKSTTSTTKIKEAKLSSMIPSSHGQVDSSHAQPSPSTMESSHLILNTNNNSHATTTSQPYFSTMSMIVDQLQDPQMFLNSSFSQHLISNEHASFRSKVDGFFEY